MRRLGCIVALLGLALASTSLFLFGAAAWRLLHPATAVMVALPLDGAALPLDGRAELRAWCRVELDSDSVNRDGKRWCARYALPLAWRVDDGAGRDLAGGAATLDWEAAKRAVIDEHGTRESASAIIEHPLARLALPKDAHPRAWAALGDDATWHAHVRRAWLIFRDDETEAGALALGGGAVLALGPMLAATGLAIVVFSFLRRREEKREAKRTSGEKPPATGA